MVKPGFLRKVGAFKPWPPKPWYGLVTLIPLVLVVFCLIYVRGPKDREELLPKYANANSQFIELSDGKVAHLRDEGNRDGPPLILLHGSNSSLQTWEPWVALLGDRFRMVSVDLPGHGLTGAVAHNDYSLAAMEAFLHKLADKLEISRFALAGNSMGGAIAAQYAADHPDRVMALILIDPAGIPPEGGAAWRPLAMRVLDMPVLGSAMRWFNPRHTIEDVLHRAFHDQSKVTESMIERYYDLLLYDGNREATRKRAKDMPLGKLDIRTSFANIVAPALILWGEQDRLLPAGQAALFRDGIKGARLVTYANVGHMPMEEIPERSAADVRAFLETQAAADAVAGSYGAKPAEDGSGKSLVPALRGGKGAVEVAPLQGQ